jgi:alanine dehydrogenase
VKSQHLVEAALRRGLGIDSASQSDPIMLFLTEQDVKDALAGGDAFKEAVDVIEQVFRQQSAGTTYHLKRYTMTHPAHPGHLWHNIRMLPGMVPELGAAAVRVYSGYRGTNRSEVICLFDWADMRMSAIISDFYLHAVRTSAPYGVAAKYLARSDASTLGIIGTGRYARGMASAICAVRPIKKIQAYSRDPANVQSFCDTMRARLGIDVVACSAGRDAVRDADIVVTATSGNTIVLEADWLEPGMLVMSLAPGEFGEQTVLRSRVFLSAIDQVLGDDPPRKPFDSLVAGGRFGPNDVVADLCDVVAGKKPGRGAEEEIILYECPGLGLLDAGIGHWVYQRAQGLGLGTEMPFGEEI